MVVAMAQDTRCCRKMIVLDAHLGTYSHSRRGKCKVWSSFKFGSFHNRIASWEALSKVPYSTYATYFISYAPRAELHAMTMSLSQRNQGRVHSLLNE